MVNPCRISVFRCRQFLPAPLFAKSEKTKMENKNIVVISLLFLIVILFSSCAWFETKKEKTAEELISEGMAYYEDEEYQKAIEAFEKINNWYPYSKHVMLSELKSADAYYHLKRYDEAVIFYEQFERMHPRNEAVPYVMYQIGMCHFNRIESVDRDQTPTRRALKSFLRLVNTYPENQYSQKAKEHIRYCRKTLAGHELYVGKYYFKTGMYKSAMGRFKIILENFAGFENFREQALSYIKRCEEELTQKKFQENIN